MGFAIAFHEIVFILTVLHCWNAATAVVSPTESNGLILVAKIFPFSEIIEKFPTCMVHIIELADGLHYLDSASVPVVLHRAENWNGLNKTERIHAVGRMRVFSTAFKAHSFSCILMFTLVAGLENAAVMGTGDRGFRILYNSLILSPAGHLFTAASTPHGLQDEPAEKILPEYMIIFDFDCNTGLTTKIIDGFISRTLYSRMNHLPPVFLFGTTKMNGDAEITSSAFVCWYCRSQDLTETEIILYPFECSREHHSD